MGTLKSNALHMFGSRVLVALFQGSQFVLIARALGAHDFGRMAGVLAITAVLLPFSALGAENVVVIRLARGTGEAQVYFGNGLLMTLFIGALLVLIYYAIGLTYFHSLSTPGMLLIFGISEIIVTKLIDIAGHVFYGFERHAYSGMFYSMHSFFRMLFAALFFALFYQNGEFLLHMLPALKLISMPADRLEVWAWFHLVAGLTTFLIVFCVTVHEIGWPRSNLNLALKELRIGIFYSIGVSAKSVYTNIDKTILARFASPEINGAYTAAFRLIYMAFAPIEAILIASTPQFFRAGSKGIELSFHMATRIIIYGVMYCLLFAIVVFAGAPLIPLILGKSYQLSTEILCWLAFLPIVILIQNAYSDALTGADRQKARSSFQVIVAAVCFALNIILVPRFSWLGSVVSTYLSQLILSTLIIVLIINLVHKERKIGLDKH